MPSCISSKASLIFSSAMLWAIRFMYLGELIEFDRTEKIFTAPRDPRTRNYVTGRFG